jgi:hypothetical protein
VKYFAENIRINFVASVKIIVTVAMNVPTVITTMVMNTMQIMATVVMTAKLAVFSK